MQWGLVGNLAGRGNFIVILLQNVLFLCVTGDLDSSMVETVVGIITGLILLVSVVIGILLWMRRNGRNISSAFPFQRGSGGGRGGAFPLPFPWRRNWSSVPTHIVTQTNPTTEGVKVRDRVLLNCSNLSCSTSIYPFHTGVMSSFTMFSTIK